MAGFDYRMVWARHLMGANVLVHAMPEHMHYVNAGTRREVVRTPCGRQEVFVRYRGTLADGVAEIGITLAAGHAERLGARFCRLCWPEMRGTD